jgi:phage-related protein
MRSAASIIGWSFPTLHHGCKKRGCTVQKPVVETLREWESGQEMTLETARAVAQNLDELMESEIDEIERLAERDPDAAFGRLMGLITFFNAAAAKVPSIIKRLEKWAKKLVGAAKAVAKNLGASSVSVSVGWPGGVSVGLSFPIT